MLHFKDIQYITGCLISPLRESEGTTIVCTDGKIIYTTIVISINIQTDTRIEFETLSNYYILTVKENRVYE